MRSPSVWVTLSNQTMSILCPNALSWVSVDPSVTISILKLLSIWLNSSWRHWTVWTLNSMPRWLKIYPIQANYCSNLWTREKLRKAVSNTEHWKEKLSTRWVSSNSREELPSTTLSNSLKTVYWNSKSWEWSISAGNLLGWSLTSCSLCLRIWLSKWSRMKRRRYWKTKN